LEEANDDEEGPVCGGGGGGGGDVDEFVDELPEVFGNNGAGDDPKEDDEPFSCVDLPSFTCLILILTELGAFEESFFGAASASEDEEEAPFELELAAAFTC